MNRDDYLWNRSGEPDADVERLESLLGELGHRPAPLVLPAAAEPRAVRQPAAWRGPALLLALAATVVFLVSLDRPREDPGRGWTVEPLTGAPRLGGASVEHPSALGASRWIETDRGSSARLGAGDVGFVDLEPGSRARLVESRKGNYRLALERGVLHARIWATPGQFFVETPSATAVDLGCAYTLEVDRTGTTRLAVTSGWVGLRVGGRTSFVPAGASCTTRPGRPPGIPRFDDAPPGLVEALGAIESSEGAVSAAALDAALSSARARDAFSLWHLLTRVDRRSAAIVCDRLAALAPPPAGASRDRVLSGDRTALDSWWDSLGLGDASWYRRYTAGR